MWERIALREDAVDSQLKVVHPLEREVEPRAEAAEDEIDDAEEAALRGNREDDRVHAHATLVEHRTACGRCCP